MARKFKINIAVKRKGAWQAFILAGLLIFGASLPAAASYIPFNTSVNMNVGIGTSTPQGAFVVTNGNVGIGTWAPVYTLDVKGTIRAMSTSPSVFGNGTTGGIQIGDGIITKTVGSAFTTDGIWSVGPGGPTTPAYSWEGYNSGLFGPSGAATSIGFESNNLEVMRLAGPNLGIGSTAPGQMLDVQGTVRMTGLTLTGNGALAGNVMVTNGVGVGTWMAPSTLATSGGTSGWTISGNNVYETNSGNVGIGTTTVNQGALVVTNGNVGIGTWAPKAVLDVEGITSVAYFNGNVGIGTWKPTGPIDVVEGGTDILNLTPTGFLSLGSGIDTNGVQVNSFSVAVYSPTSSGGQFPDNAIYTDSEVGHTSLTGHALAFEVFNSADISQYATIGGYSTNGTSPILTFTQSTGGSSYAERMRLDSNGNLGIGSTAPGQILDVQGTVRTTGFILNLNPVAGDILMTNGVGVGTWIPASSVGGAAAGTNYWINNAGNVGINTTYNIGVGTISAVNSLNILGNVGVGTVSYSKYLQMAAPNGGAAFEGNVGVGTWAPGNSLDVVGGNIGIGTVYSLVGIGTTSTILTLRSDTSSIYVGWQAGASTTEPVVVGLANTAVGSTALNQNTFGNFNTAIGYSALRTNIAGSFNTAMGESALFSGVLQNDSTAIGYQALLAIGSAGGSYSDNTALGYQAGFHILGGGVLTTPTQSTFLGESTEAMANNDTNETVIGYAAVGNGSNTVTLGNTSIVATILQGNVGIGSVAPGQILDVHGTARMTGFILTGNGASAGNVMVTNGVGVGTWMAASTLSVSASGASGWTISGNDVYETSGGNVGIGTTITNAAALSIMNGNVGIGTWAPQTAAQIAGDLSLTTGTTRNIYVTDVPLGAIANGNDLFVHAGNARGCFAANTKIAMGDGQLKNIQDIKIGEIVKSYDVKTRQVKNSKVTQVFHHSSKDVSDGYLVVTTQNGRVLRVTPNHPIYVNGKWKQAGDLKSGDLLTQIDGSKVRLVSIKIIKAQIPVYNLEVDQYHTYFAEGLLVHNKPFNEIGGNLYMNGGGAALGGGFNEAPGNVVLGYTPEAIAGIYQVGLVGIGTVSPTSVLTILGNIGVGTMNGDAYLTTAPPKGGAIIYGNVGIGFVAPGQALDVNGTVRMTGFTLNSNPNSGYVLVGNGVGVGTWMAASTLSVSGTSGWTISGNNVYETSSGNVGIGTTTVNQGALLVTNGNVGIGTWVPFDLLDVNGTINPFVVTSTGNVGIGTWVPQFIFDVVRPNGETYVDANGFLHAAIAFSQLFHAVVESPGNLGLEVDGYFAGQVANLANFEDGNGNILTFIDKSGNVGIGTEFQFNQLDVKGSAAFGAYGGVKAAPANSIIVSGNVGVGSAAPGQALDVQGTVRTTGFTLSNNGASSGNVMVTNGIGVGTWMAAGTLPITGTVNGLTANYVPKASSPTALINSLIYDTGINVGIGSINPSATFDVNGAIAAGGSSNSYFSAGNVGVGTTTPQSLLSVVGGNVGIGTWTAGNSLSVIGGMGIGSSTYANTAAPLNGIIVSGNVGVGSLAPGQMLDVQGTARTIGFTMSGQTPISGYVLTASDSSGDTTWSSPGTVGGWTESGSNVYETSGGNVGIGTTIVNQGGLVVMNGNVGVGTWAPGALLTVGKNAFEVDSSGNIIAAGSFAGPGSVGINSGAGLSTTGNVNVVYTPSGALPWPYQVASSASTISIANFVAGDYFAGFNNFTVKNTNNITQDAYIGAVAMPGAGTYSPSIIFGHQTGPSSYNETMRIDQNGNVGINTVSPIGLLDTEGTVVFNAAVTSIYNVGIGSFAPGKKLDVQGTVRTIGFTMSGQTPISGYVLTASDSSGDTTWSSPGIVGGWTESGSNVYETSGGNVGIGTTIVNQGGLVVMSGNVGIGTWVPGYSLDIAGGNIGNSLSSTLTLGSVGTPVQTGNNVLDNGTGYMLLAGYLTFDAVQDQFISIDTNPANAPGLNLYVQGGQGGTPGVCFAANTKITMGDSQLKNIQDITVGEIVRSYDAKTGQVKNSKVIKVFHHSSKDVSDGYLVLTMQNGRTLKVTPNHPIYVDGQWKQAGTLKSGDRLMREDGSKERLVSIKIIKGQIPVYNLEVDRYHTYFAEGLLVHNKLGQPGGNLYLDGGAGGSGGAPPSGSVILAYNNPANVGIGTVTPSQKLDVIGTVRAIGFTMSGQTPISGYVLTAQDSSGDTTWSSPGTVGGWTVSGNNVYETSGGNVGIGTTFVTTAGLTVMNGNVGIGTWVPGTALQVNNTATFASEYNNGLSGSTNPLNINWNNGNRQKITLTGAPVFNFTPPTSGIATLLLKLVQDGSGNHTVTWPASVKWPSGISPILTTTAGQEDVITCYYDGADYLCVTSLNFTP